MLVIRYYESFNFINMIQISYWSTTGVPIVPILWAVVRFLAAARICLMSRHFVSHTVRAIFVFLKWLRTVLVTAKNNRYEHKNQSVDLQNKKNVFVNRKHFKSKKEAQNVRFCNRNQHKYCQTIAGHWAHHLSLLILVWSYMLTKIYRHREYIDLETMPPEVWKCIATKWRFTIHIYKLVLQSTFFQATWMQSSIWRKKRRK